MQRRALHAQACDLGVRGERLRLDRQRPALRTCDGEAIDALSGAEDDGLVELPPAIGGFELPGGGPAPFGHERGEVELAITHDEASPLDDLDAASHAARVLGDVYYRDFLGRIHELLEPPTYLEIGVRNGDSLALARSPSIGIDPAYNLKVAPPPGAKLFPVTSDDFFERAEPLMTFEGRRVGFSFIDGMHLSEFALRDFVNVERHADWTAAIVFDDILPRDIPEANRDRSTHQWTGDVYKVLEALEEHRPDLIILRVGTEPTGLGLVLGVDPDSTVLADRLDTIAEGLVQPDPQPVPDAVLERRGALEPDAVLAASFWSVLRDLRDRGAVRDEGLPQLRAAIERDFGG